MQSFGSHDHRANASAGGGVPTSPPSRGVLLINLGSPDAPTADAVRVYLREFLSDPAVIQLPRGFRWFNGPLGALIARFRCHRSAEMYQTVWTDKGSPLLSITQEQAEALQKIMPAGWRVYMAMRYGNPSIPDTLRRIEQEGIQDLVIVPMYPQYSGPTTGTAMRDVYDYFGREPHPMQITTRLIWFNDHSYVSAQADLLRKYAGQHGLTPDNTFLLFSAHGLPESYVRKGDPYPEQIAESVALVANRAGWESDRFSLAFQSRFGPTKWLQPYTDEVLTKLAADGQSRILVCPISFTVDCLETLEEIDVRYRALVESGTSQMFVCPALNTFQPFIMGLKHLVLQGCSPVNGTRSTDTATTDPAVVESSASDSVDIGIDSLVMVGASIEGRVTNGQGPALRHVSEDELRLLKRPACSMPDLLSELKGSVGLSEAFIWNTCHRFELYGWLPSGHDERERDRCLAELAKGISATKNESCPELNTLTGKNALHHLVRTAVGLNSRLPGERDVSTQLEAALRLAERAGTTEKLCKALMKRVKSMSKEVREKTQWRAYNPDYAQVALQHVADKVKFDWLNCRVTVIGGSTTSASVLRTLTKHFGVPSKQLTLVYRGHKHGHHLSLLRQAIGQGKRIRVQSYTEAVVDRAIEHANIIVLGVDHEEPILDRERLQKCRGIDKPLTILDFNSFPSTMGLDEIESVRLFALNTIDQAVNRLADSMCADSAFQEAVRECDDWIRTAVEDADGSIKQSSAGVCRASLAHA